MGLPAVKRVKRLAKLAYLGTVVIGILLLFLHGCGESKTEIASPSRYGGTLYVGVEIPFYGLDIFGTGGGGILLADMAMLNHLIQKPLFRMDSSGNLVPVLGLSAPRAPDGTAWTVRLREGNGAEIILVNATTPPLNDVRGRRALDMANRQDLHVRLIYGDAIPVVHHPFGEWFRCMEDRYL